MCTPAAGFLALQAASSMVSYAGQRQQADAKTTYQRQLMAAERQRQMDAETNLRLRQQDEQESRARELAKVSQEARAMAARNITAAGEAGLSTSSASVDALLAEGTRRELDFYESMDRQGQLQGAAYDREIESGRKGSAMRILDINRPVSRPSFAGLAIDLGKAGLSTYDFAQRDYQIRTQGLPVRERPAFSFPNSLTRGY